MNPLSTPLLRGTPPAASKYLKVHLTHRKDPQFNCSREDGPHVNLGSIVCKFYLSFGFALKCDPTRELLNEASFSATKKAIWKNGPCVKTEENPTLNYYEEFWIQTPLPTPKMCNQIFFAFFQFHLIAFQCVKSSRSKLKRLAHKIFLLLGYAKS